MGIYQDKTAMSNILVPYNQLYLATAEFPRIKLKIRDCLQYCKSVQRLIYIKFRKCFFNPNISGVVCFEVSPRPFGYCVTLARDSWQDIHQMSSKWNKMCQPQKKKATQQKYYDKSKLSHMAKGMGVVKLLPICQ